MSADPIAVAAQMLATAMYCRAEADALRADSGSADAREAYARCNADHRYDVMAALTKLASRNCPREVADFGECVERKGSEEACEAEDLRALRCAAYRVLETES